MNYQLTHIPERPVKPRDHGLTMVMDKGLAIRQAEDLIEASGPHRPGEARLRHLLRHQQAGRRRSSSIRRLKIRVYLGGTLFEAFVARGQFKDFRKLIDQLGLDTAEVSDGSITMSQKEKCRYIGELSKQCTVLSEVGSKESGILISPTKWVNMMNAELEAGSWKVIAEARESGTVGIYRPSGHAHTQLVNRILAKVPAERIMWEAPQKAQQVWFIKQLGANVNLGNIAPEEVIPLETLRLGLRGDTFFQYLPEDVAEKLRQVKG
ncbi:MAG: phosphosulfolactate synthase [Flavobacteriales bacterium]|nr:phosphosulfolactate synthase [Flavobacteriales bacterium]